MLKIHTIKAARGAKKVSKRIGRGNASGRGTSAGRGGKGQTARSGGSRGLWIKAFKAQLQSTPKLRGFKSIHTKASEVYLSDLEKHFEAGAIIDLQALKDKNLVGVTVKAAKVLSTGEIAKKLTISGLLTTKAAAEKIKAAGGDIK